MKKICQNCQKEYEDGQSFCPHCGALLSDGETDSKNAVERNVGFNGTPYQNPYGNPYAYISAETEEERKEREVKQKKARVSERKKKLFTLSFVALLLDFICGIGCSLGVYVSARATGDYKFLLREEKKRSAQLVWAMTIGYIATLLGFLFFLMFL